MLSINGWPCADNGGHINSSASITDSLSFIKKHMNGQNDAGHLSGYNDNFRAIATLVDMNNESFCTGAIIEKDTIVTAASCIDGKRENEVFVRVGDRVRDLKEQYEELIGVALMIPHPYYDPLGPMYNATPRIVHDIGLVLLKKDLNLTEFTVGKFTIPDGTEKPHYEDHVFSYGWGSVGYLDASKGYASSTKVGRTAHLTKVECNPDLSPFFICYEAGDHVHANGICVSDFGGPIVSNKYPKEVMGIFSNMNSLYCTQPNAQARFTNVTHYLDFVKSKWKGFRNVG